MTNPSKPSLPEAPTTTTTDSLADRTRLGALDVAGVPSHTLATSSGEDRDTRHEQRHVGSWNVSAAYSGPYRGFGAQIDLYAFTTVDNAICSYHMGLTLEAGRGLYAALRAVLYPTEDGS